MSFVRLTMKKDVRETVRLLHNNIFNLEQQLQFVESRNDLQEVAVWLLPDYYSLECRRGSFEWNHFGSARIINLIVMMLE